MFRHYLVTAGRSLVHHKLYSVINIAGLSIGLAAATLIVLYIRDELSYDKWIPDTGDLYRLEVTFNVPGRAPMPLAMAPFPVVTEIAAQIPQVKAVTHVMPEHMTVNIGDHQFRQTITFVDPNFLRVIKLPLVEGDPARVLAQPESVVLSQSAARKFFGTVDPIGKTLTLGQNDNSACGANDSACLSAVYPVIVTGVLRDLPHNTQLVADVVVPNTSRADEMTALQKTHDWTSGDRDYGYVQLTHDADPAAVLAELKPILDRSYDPRKFGINLSSSELEQYRLTPFRDAHLTSDSDEYGGMTPGGSWTTVYGLGVIALLIVLIACCNFTNLASARATLRAREIAVRKMGGAKRGELILQFLVEAVMFSIASFAIALSLVEILLPLYSRFLERTIAFHYLADWELLAALIAGAIAVGLASGLYPAVVLSGFRPALSLRSAASRYSTPGLLRSALVVTQFAISIGLGIAALVVVSQIDFARQVNLGFDRDGIVVIRGVSRLTPAARKDLAAELRTDPQILGVAYSNAVPFDTSYVENDEIRTEGKPESVLAQVMNIGPEFPSLYGMKLLAGRFLSDRRGEDLSAHGVVHNMLINATGARRLGFSANNVVGRRVTVIGAYTATIVGVLSDTKFEGLREPVRPTLYYFDESDRHATQDLSIRIRGTSAVDALSFIDRAWRSFAPGAASDQYYLSDAFDSLFKPDEKQGELLGIFVCIAIVIACLGLFGLAVFTAERRTKEIGIRKIAGARTHDILALMLWRISVPVLFANLIAWPIAYHYLARWLEGYAYRISLSPVYFLAGAAAALAVAWATVFAHTLRLAHATPVHALRYE
jgi:putative ABC transport system permease protein